MKVHFQHLLTRVGTLASPRLVAQANAALNYVETGRWLRAAGYRVEHRFRDRAALHAHVAGALSPGRVLYLEFGVFEGASLRMWSALLQGRTAELHGFDSFEGLPEAWDARRPQGTFSVGGRLPAIADPRVHLHVGWFNDTLPTFELPPHEQLVLHLDADLYSSTIFVLRELSAFLRPGAVVIFDEFCDRLHELRAWDEFLRDFPGTFRCLGGTRNLEQVGFMRVD